MADIWTALGSVASLLGRLIPKSNKRELARFERIYAPMLSLFLTRHITTSSSIMAPYLGQRLRNARDLFAKHRYIRALKAVFDKQTTEPTAEIEYGGSFPLAHIHKIVKGNEMYCDEKLLNLIARADRSRYEDMPGDSDVTLDELALFQHIAKQHHALTKKYVGK